MNRRNNSGSQAEAATSASSNQDRIDTQAKPQEQEISTGFLVFINLGMVLAGTMTTVFGKIMD